MELAGSINLHLRPAFFMEDILEDGSLNINMLASSSSQLHACTGSILGDPSTLMNLGSQDTHLGPGIMEKSCLSQEDSGKACFRDSQKIPIRLSGERGLLFRIF